MLMHKQKRSFKSHEETKQRKTKKQYKGVKQRNKKERKRKM